jgi:GT2 family glycosyltransferase
VERLEEPNNHQSDKLYCYNLLMIDLSVIILSYNTENITKKCLTSLFENLSKDKITSEIIIVDNGSKDGSVNMIKEFVAANIQNNISYNPIFNDRNMGYPKGNNQGLKTAKGKYTLFLNSDVLIKNVSFEKILTVLDQDQNIGAMTVKVILPTGGIDPASHRGFPNLWNSFCYFSKLEKIFCNIPYLNNIFGGYHLTGKNLSLVHEIDSPTGAFYLSPTKILNEVKGFDESFFMYGEDLDLSFRIKENNYKILYYPFDEVVHLKYSSGLKKDAETSKKTKKYFYEAMKIFYKKHYEKKSSFLINKFVYFIIDFKSKT